MTDDKSKSRALAEFTANLSWEAIPDSVKHRAKLQILDAIGDLYLLGHNLIGEFFGFKTGHALNYELLKKIESENAYKIIEIDEIKDAPINYLKPISEEVA